jgi:hypothetical protein
MQPVHKFFGANCIYHPQIILNLLFRMSQLSMTSKMLLETAKLPNWEMSDLFITDTHHFSISQLLHKPELFRHFFCLHTPLCGLMPSNIHIQTPCQQ